LSFVTLKNPRERAFKALGQKPKAQKTLKISRLF